MQIYFRRLSYFMKQWNDLYNSFYWIKNSGIGVLEKSWLFCDWKQKLLKIVIVNSWMTDMRVSKWKNISLNTWKINSQEDLLFFAKLGICCNICYISKLFVIFCFNWFPNFSLFSFLKKIHFTQSFSFILSMRHIQNVLAFFLLPIVNIGKK